VLATFEITLILNNAVRFIWGPGALFAKMPSVLAGQVSIGGVFSYRYGAGSGMGL
jgi:branched-subunit amino acid ABC-type transport system permease component